MSLTTQQLAKIRRKISDAWTLTGQKRDVPEKSVINNVANAIDAVISDRANLRTIGSGSAPQPNTFDSAQLDLIIDEVVKANGNS